MVSLEKETGRLLLFVVESCTYYALICLTFVKLATQNSLKIAWASTWIGSKFFQTPPKKKKTLIKL
jgi:hypothetical protein